MELEQNADSPIVDKLKERYAMLRLSTQEDFEDETDVSPAAGENGSSTFTSPQAKSKSKKRWPLLRTAITQEDVEVEAEISPVASDSDSAMTFNSAQAKSKGKKRWSLLKTAIMMIPEKEGSLKSSFSGSPLESSSKGAKATAVDPAEEANKLLDFWMDDSAPIDVPLSLKFPEIDRAGPADAMSSHNRLFDDQPRAAERVLLDAAAADYVDQFASEARDCRLVISKVPEEFVKRKKEELDAEVVAEKRRDAQENIKQQAQLLFLENEARERVQRLQDEAMTRVKAQKDEMVSHLFAREAAIGREFRRAREVLELDLKKEQASLMEKHGQLLSGEQSISRRFEVQWTLCPQPVEMRIHVMRAVKNKLPKGSYVVMLTQFDRLGGKPMVWSVSGAYGIGKDRPATTRPFKHHGRFFDRVLKVEDSTFALCPPPEKLRPGNCFIIELFQLATRRNPVNRVVGWAALPLCTSQFSVVEGRFKLPILRGEHTPSVQHYRTIEHIIGDDLNSWLCNIYVEIKHLPKMFTSKDGTSTDEYQIEFNYMKKLLSLGGGRNAAQEENEDIENQREGELDPLIPQPKRIKQNDTRHFTGKAKLNAGYKNSAAIPEDDDENADREEDYYDFSKSNQPSEFDNLASTNQLNNSKYGANGKGDLVGVARQRGKSGDGNKILSSHGQSYDDSQRKSRGSTGGIWNSVRNMFSTAKTATDETELLLNDLNSANQSNTSRTVVRFEDVPEGPVGRIWGNGQTTDEEDEDEQVEVLERGYDPEDEFFLDSQQIGKLAGLETIGKEEDRQWAASGMSNGVVRRWQSDGPRFDSEAVNAKMNLSAHVEEQRRKMLGEIDEKGRYTTWSPLTDKKDFDLYSVAVSADPSRRRKLLPSALVKSKLRFILQEALGDLWFENWGTFDFYVTLFAYLMTLWLRMLIHYIGQYFFLQAVQTPVYSFKLTAVEIVFKYISTAVPVSYEVALVAIGPLSNIFCFICLAFLCHMFYNLAGTLPDSASLFVCAYGVWTVLDPFAILLVDLSSHNYKCGDYDAICKDDYTSMNCNCFEGDWFKLWTRYRKDEGSGVTGLFVTFMLYFSTVMVSLLILYEYLVRVHKDARILDIWRRINAPAEDLFIPLDFEISLDELRTICAGAAAWKGPEGSSRRLVVSEYIETDPFDDTFRATTHHFAIYELTLDGNRKLYRHFLKLQDGSIIEIFEQLSIDLSTQYRTLENLLGQDGKLAFKAKHKQIFGGMDHI